MIGAPKKHHIEEVEKGLNYLKECFLREYDIVIADEILYAVQLGLLTEEKIVELITKKPEDKELILTGSHKELLTVFAKADLVTEVRKIKHPYDTGILARKGIEY